MATSLDACQRIVDEVGKSGQKLSVAHYRRALPAFLKVKALLDERAIGDIRFVQIRLLQPAQSKLIAQTETNWRVAPEISGGGLFHDIAPHQLDLMYLYFGKPRSVSGQAFNQAAFYPAEDIVSASMTFAGNVLFQGLWCFTAPEEAAREYCEIIGEKGSIQFSFYGAEVQLRTDQTETFTFKNPENIQLPMIEQVNQYFSGRGQNPCTAEEGMLVMEMLQQISGRK
jgi:predicted dehydrogenase